MNIQRKCFEDFKKYHNANYHDGDSHFDERTYKQSNGDDFDCSFVHDCYDHFEAGAASRQAEIDELQKRIDEAMKYVSESPLKDVSRRAMLNFLDILKGESND